MKMSETLSNLGKALAGFNSEVSKIAQDARNPQFRSNYVTLDALIDGTKPILQKNGLSVLQFPISCEDGKIGVKSLLLHSSGEFIEGEPLYMTPVRMIKGGDYVVATDAQAAGSTISYLRRYSYQAILNLSTGEDDDGETSVGRGRNSNSTDSKADKEPKSDREERPTRTERSNREESTEPTQDTPVDDTQAENAPQEETSRGRGRRGSEDAEEAPRRGRGRR